ncbi:putative B3 domain-containing protein [Spatholobus suberectus]|nr:putative B3 domain-containing protein [Spatholobus suberectus]
MESALPCSGDKTLQEFFKVFLLQTGSSQLQIPTSFTKFFNGTTPCKVTLVDHDGKSWDVYLERIEGRLVLKNGWQQFAREKDLEEGDFLVFQYDGWSTFNVKIFSKTGCRKVAAPAPASCGKIVPIVILDEDSDSRCNKTQCGRKRKHSPSSLKINEKSVLEGPCQSADAARCKSERVHEENDNHHEKKAGLTNLVPLQDPHFQIYFNAPWRLKKVEVPRRVLSKMNIKLIPKISLRDENDKLWPVAIITTDYGHRRHFLGGGWSDFKRSNNIQEGHLCDFQFVLDKANVAQELLVRVRSKCPIRWVGCK